MKKIFPLLFLFFGPLVILFYLYPTVTISPNSSYLNANGEGYKHYFTQEYHIQHDSTYLHFGGMNYPFGEQLIFTDGQPLLSVTLKFLANHISYFQHHVFGFLNLAIFLSFFWGTFLIYKILKSLEVESLWAAASAVLIAGLSPQLFRMQGHYALSYICFFPGLWLLLIRHFKNQTSITSVFVVLWLIAWGFIHPYLLAMGVMFVFFWWLFILISHKSIFSRRKAIFNLTFQAILPALIFKVIVLNFDTVHDRPESPFGFFEFRAYWSSVFFPLYLPHGNWIENYADFTKVSWEGYAYVGFAGLGLIAAAVTYFSRRFWLAFSGKNVAQLPNAIIFVSAFAGFSLLLFSFRYPFVSFLRESIYSIPGLSQFRSIGRFAWPFYYVWSVLAAWVAWRVFQYLKEKKNIFYSLSFTVGFFCVGALESALWLHFLKEKSGLTLSKSDLKTLEVKGKELEWITKIKPNEYAALLILPYFQIGSENFTILNEGAEKIAMQASLLSGLPLVNSTMPRTSLSQALQQFQFITEPIHPVSVPLLYEKKPLLVVSLKSIPHDRPYYLPNFGELVFENESVNVYALSFETLLSIGKEKAKEESEKFLAEFASLITQENGLLVNQNDDLLFYESFDDSLLGFSFAGKGGNEKEGWGFNYLYRNKPEISEPQILIASVWVLAFEDLRPLTEFWVETIDPKGVAHHATYQPLSTSGVAISRGWVLAEQAFTVYPGEEIRIMARKDSKFPRKVNYDEFLLRKKSTEVWKITENKIMHNNRWWEASISQGLISTQE